MDGVLAPHEAAALAAHLQRCAACRAELAVWERLSAEVKGLFAEVPAPPGFASRVMDRLPAASGGWAARLGRGFRRGLAVAASFGIILAGSVGYAAYRWLGGGEPSSPPPGTFRPPVVAQNGEVEEPEFPLPPVKPSGNTGVAPGNGATGPVHTKPDKNTPGAKVTRPENRAQGGPAGEPRAFLESRTRVVTRTLLQVAVVDVEQAAAGARALAGTAEAQLRDETTTRTGDVFQTYIIDKDKAPVFCRQLAELGKPVGKPLEQTEDLTAAYERDLERYRELLNRASAATAPEEKERLLQQAKQLEAQLVARDREASQHTVVLWLKKNEESSA
ncbi:MAG: hypothetical protein AB1776_07040 [Bacillota bacterium]